MSKKLVCLETIIVVLLSIFSLVGCTDKNVESRKWIKEFAEIEVPGDSTVIYYFYDDTFVNGRKAQHAVFQFETEPTDWLKENNFLDGRDDKNERSFKNYFGFATIKTEDIPMEYIPNFENPYLWIQTQVVFFFYYPDTQRLIVFIAGS